MATSLLPADVGFPRATIRASRSIAGPGYNAFVARFGGSFPRPIFLESDLGKTAVYELPPPSTKSQRRVLIVHGVNTPALGMIPFIKGLQARDPDTHIVLFDLWGHGLSSTPLIAHTPQIFHSQILQVLAHLQWSNANLIGFSFGGATIASFAVYNPVVPLSVVLVAPAGLMSRADCGKELDDLLNANGKDAEAIQSLLDWLGAGPTVLPDGWQTQLHSIQIFAKALKQWELDEHQGYQSSVLSMIRDGGAFGKEEIFRRFSQLLLRKMAILGEQDGVCSELQLQEVGMDDIKVLKQADHDLIRVRADEVADIVYQFWIEGDMKQLSLQSV